MAQRIQAVTLDVGGTLIEPWPSVGHVYAEVAARFGVRAEPAALNAGFGAAWKTKKDFNYSRAHWFELVQASFTGFGPLPAEYFPAVYERFAEPDVWRIFEDVQPALESLLARGIRLAAISNWDERLHPLLKRLGLDVHFETVIASHQIGVTKPSPAIFSHALKQLGLPPDAVLHVGDGATEDLAGARAAGLGAVLIHRGSGHPPAGAITDLQSLVKQIERI